MNVRIARAASICATCIYVFRQSGAQDRRDVPAFRRYGSMQDQAPLMEFLRTDLSAGKNCKPVPPYPFAV